MSKLDELINEFCPNGVEYKTINEVCNISRGVVISKEDISNNIGEYPVYSSQTENNGELGSINTYAFDGEYLTWTTDGANAGTVFYRAGKFSVTNVCGLLKVMDSDNSARYIFHVLSVEAPKYVRSGMGNPKLMSNVMGSIKIPIPPLPVQEEIVRILDNFTELIAELTARKKQYEYYRDSLLLQSNCIPMLPLKTVVKKSCSGGTPTKGNSAYYVNGDVPWLRTQDVRFNEIYEIDSFITEEAVAKTSAKWIPANCVIIAISGATAGRCAINKIPTTTNQHCFNLEIDNSKALYKYVFYCVCSQYEELILRKQGARGDLNSSLVLGINIPIPYPENSVKSLTEQQRIIDILDRFNTLCNDISSGLPAEIKARKKQYEYYRDKLLTFENIDLK